MQHDTLAFDFGGNIHGIAPNIELKLFLPDNPAEFGLENVESTCIAFFAPNTPICAEPEKFMFWDGIHATGRVYRIVGEKIAAMYQ